MVARSRGGKGGLAPPAGLILEVEEAVGPALTPVADGVGVKTDLQGGSDIGDVGLLVQKDNQTRPLEQMRRRCAAAQQ